MLQSKPPSVEEELQTLFFNEFPTFGSSSLTKIIPQSGKIGLKCNFVGVPIEPVRNISTMSILSLNNNLIVTQISSCPGK